MSLKERYQEIKDKFKIEKNLGVVLSEYWDLGRDARYYIWIAKFSPDIGFDVNSIEKITVTRDVIEDPGPVKPGTIVQIHPIGLYEPSEDKLMQIGLESEDILCEFYMWLNNNRSEIEPKTIS